MNKDINERVAVLELKNLNRESMVFCSHDSCGYEKKFIGAFSVIYPKVNSYVSIEIEKYKVEKGLIIPERVNVYLTKTEAEQLITRIRDAIKEIK